jgi:myo-inositol 2-dehydrogenase / D-chiro-inositol 1-dehydrogenase
MTVEKGTSNQALTRRNFVKKSIVSLTALSTLTSRLYAAGSDTLKVGLIGCGGRGTGAATQVLLSTNTPVKLWAMGDLFQDQLDTCYTMLSEGAKGRYDREDFKSLLPKMEVPKSRRFIGFDAFKGVIDSGVDLVLLATPPHFRPEHFAAAVTAGKHIFMEKPAAVDPTGIRTILAANEIAKQKGLSVVAGTQRRHQNHYRDILQRVTDGAIGEIVSGQCYWNMGLPWGQFKVAHTAAMSDMEWQCRNWFYTTWLSGDHICEQHVHNLDIMNWGIGAHPMQVMGVGGRQARTGPEYGNIFDHFACEFQYPNGVRVSSMCKQQPGAAYHVCERLVGTKGQMYTDQASGYIKDLKNNTTYKYEGPDENPYYQEHSHLIDSIRQGKGLNEAQAICESTMCAIIGRMSAYTGRALKWNWAMKASKLDLRPERYVFGDLPLRPVAVPGKTPLI